MPPLAAWELEAAVLPHLHQSQLLADSLAGAGVPVTLRRVDGGGHGRGGDFGSEALHEEVLRFFDVNLKRGPTE